MAREPIFLPGIRYAVTLILGILLILPGFCSLSILGMSAVEGTMARDFSGPYSEIFVVIWSLSLLTGLIGILLIRWAYRRLVANRRDP